MTFRLNATPLHPKFGGKGVGNTSWPTDYSNRMVNLEPRDISAPGQRCNRQDTADKVPKLLWARDCRVINEIVKQGHVGLSVDWGHENWS